MKRTLLFACLLLSMAGYSQKSSSVTVFTDEDTQAIDNSGTYSSVMHNVVKWNIGLLGRGAFFAEYEREIFPMMSIESGLGITYLDGVNFIYQDMNGDGSSYYQTPGYGPAVSLRTRFYPSEMNDMEGFYASIAGQARWYNNKTILDSKTYNTGTAMKDVHFALGWQLESYMFDELYYDFYFGVALRSIKEHYVNGTKRKVESETINRPAFVLGFKLGYPF